jgi:hypothetical protein
MATRKLGGFKVPPSIAPQPPQPPVFEDPPGGGEWYAVISHQETNSLDNKKRASFYLIHYKTGQYSGVPIVVNKTLDSGFPCSFGTGLDWSRYESGAYVCDGDAAYTGQIGEGVITPITRDRVAVITRFTQLFGMIFTAGSPEFTASGRDKTTQTIDTFSKDLAVINSSEVPLAQDIVRLKLGQNPTIISSFEAPPFPLGWRQIGLHLSPENRAVKTGATLWKFIPNTGIFAGEFTGTMSLTKTIAGNTQLLGEIQNPLLEHEAIQWAISNLMTTTITGERIQSGSLVANTSAGTYYGTISVADAIFTNPEKLKFSA